METEYYEAYNQDNVLLVDLKETPIEAITLLAVYVSLHYEISGKYATSYSL